MLDLTLWLRSCDFLLEAFFRLGYLRWFSSKIPAASRLRERRPETPRPASQPFLTGEHVPDQVSLANSNAALDFWFPIRPETVVAHVRP